MPDVRYPDPAQPEPLLPEHPLPKHPLPELETDVSLPRCRRRVGWAEIVLPLAAAAFLMAVWGFMIEPDLLRVREVRIETGKWPAALPPLKMVAIADIHAGAPYIDEAKLDRIVVEANARDPDVVVLLGDYVENVPLGRPMRPETIARHLGQLKARHGVFAVLGNHEWYGDGEHVWRALEAVGIRVLENQAAPLPGSGGRVWLAGIADDGTRISDVPGTLRAIPKDATVIAITHDPAVFRGIPSRVALTLAGHTHGGQVVLPLWGPLGFPGGAPLRYARGHIREDGRDLFVTSGIGTSLLPVRFGVLPEIVVLTLASPPR